MENIRIFVDELDGTEHIIIHKTETEYVSMPKANWDKLQEEKQNHLGGTL